MLALPARCALVSLMLMFALLPLACNKGPLTKEQARKRFLEIAAHGCAGDYKEMNDVLRATFQKGAPASEYEEILKTAQRKAHDPKEFLRCEGADTEYFWDVNDGQDGAAFYVYTAGSIPVIVDYRIGIFDK